MRPFSAIRFDQRGFTLFELLMALAIMGLVMAGVVSLYTTGNSIYLAAANQVETQQAARGAMLMLEENLLLAGDGFPTVPGLPKITAADPISITFWADLTNGSTLLSADVNPGNKTLNVNSAAGIKSGDTVYLISGGQWEARTVSSVTGTTITITAGAGAFYPQGAQVGRPKAIRFSWNANTISKDAGEGGGPQSLADGVQAFQLRYFDAGNNEIPPVNLPGNLANIRRIAITVTVQSASALNKGTFIITSDIRPRNL